MAAPTSAALPPLTKFWVLALDVTNRSCAFEELPCPVPADALLEAVATTEDVHAACYSGVALALGKQPMDVAPYVVSADFCGHRLVVWTRDDLPPPPTNLPAVQFVLGHRTSTPWRGAKVFLAVYPKTGHAPAPLPGVSFSLHNGGSHCSPLDCRVVLKRALLDTHLAFLWLLPADADAVPTGSFSLRAAGAVPGALCALVVVDRERWLCNACGAPCGRVCGTCRDAAYCSFECQAAAWETHGATCAPPGMVRKVDASGIEGAAPQVPGHLAEAARLWRSGAAVASADDLSAAFDVVNTRLPVEELRRVGHEVAPSVSCLWLDFDGLAAASQWAGKAVRKALRGPLSGDLLAPHLVTWDERRRRGVALSFKAEQLVADGRSIFLVTLGGGGSGPTAYASVLELARTTPAQTLIIKENLRMACERLMHSCPPLMGLLDERVDATGGKAVLKRVIDRLAAKCVVCEASACLKSCASCVGVKYCGETCQLADWRRHKRTECADVKLLLDFSNKK
jgi:hypothetical protein